MFLYVVDVVVVVCVRELHYSFEWRYIEYTEPNS